MALITQTKTNGGIIFKIGIIDGFFFSIWNGISIEFFNEFWVLLFTFWNLTYRKFNKMPELIIWPVWIGTLCGWCIRFWCIGPGWWWWCEYEWCVVGVQTFWNEYRQLRRMSCEWAPSLPMAKLRLVVARRRRWSSIGRFSGADMKIGWGWDTCGICDEECCRWAAVAVKCNGVGDCPWWWSKFSFFLWYRMQNMNKIN